MDACGGRQQRVGTRVGFELGLGKAWACRHGTLMACMTSPPVKESRPDVGSSRNITRGSPTSAMPTLVRFACGQQICPLHSADVCSGYFAQYWGASTQRRPCVDRNWGNITAEPYADRGRRPEKVSIPLLNEHIHRRRTPRHQRCPDV